MTASPLVVRLNALALGIISLVLVAAFGDQLILGELPCPLCLLQRAAFLATGLGFLLNLRCGVRPRHYGIAIMGALVGAAVALRQVLLHIAPGDPGFGNALFGLHLYTWSFIAFAAILFGVAVLLSLPSAMDATVAPRHHGRHIGLITGLFVALIVGNLISTVLECGLTQCPDDPVTYEWIGGVSESIKGRSL